jgi:hypothetical protein
LGQLLAQDVSDRGGHRHNRFPATEDKNTPVIAQIVAPVCDKERVPFAMDVPVHGGLRVDRSQRGPLELIRGDAQFLCGHCLTPPVS